MDKPFYQPHIQTCLFTLHFTILLSVSLIVLPTQNTFVTLWNNIKPFSVCADFMDFPSNVEMETLMIHDVWGSTDPLFISFIVFGLSQMMSRRTLQQVLTNDNVHKISSVQLCNVCILNFMFSYFSEVCNVGNRCGKIFIEYKFQAKWEKQRCMYPET